MGRFLPGRPSPALVISVIALILGLAGTTYAVGVGGGSAKRITTRTKLFNKGANEDQTVTLAKNRQFKVVGNCDDNDTHTPGGFDFAGTWIGIKNRGQNNGVAETSDDDDYDFDIGDGAAFNYEDGGDEGEAILRNGHWMSVEGSIDFDAGSTTQFSTDCRFAGAARFH